MVPPQVKFLWRRQKQNGPLEELPDADGEQLQLEESGRTVSIRKVDRVALNTYKYSCSVKHEGGTVEAQTEQGDEGLVTVFGGDSCEDDSVSEVTPSPETGGQDWHRHRLLCMMYTVLIAKGLVYCCGLSLLRILRTKVLCSGSSTNIEDDL
ncbi:hypothetical protein Q8A73_015590 [Channa argus]|nr:hypothetical protein Q8A73_015590 [Channa argus]